MKKTICLWALLLIVVSMHQRRQYNDEHGDKAVIPPKGRIIRIMTYNIYGARATSPANAADLDALAEVIRRQDPDFVTLNEVDVFTNRTGKDVHQARDLAAKLGMEWHFSKAIDRDGGEYGDAVLSKHPIIETRSYRLPAPLRNRERTVRCASSASRSTAKTSMSPRRTSIIFRAMRAAWCRPMRSAVSATRNWTETSSLRATSTPPSSNVIATMTAFLTNVGTIDQYTFPSENPTRKIDYILYAPIGHFGVQNCTVVSRSDQQVDGVDASEPPPRRGRHPVPDRGRPPGESGIKRSEDEKTAIHTPRAGSGTDAAGPGFQDHAWPVAVRHDRRRRNRPVDYQQTRFVVGRGNRGRRTQFLRRRTYPPLRNRRGPQTGAPRHCTPCG